MLDRVGVIRDDGPLGRNDGERVAGPRYEAPQRQHAEADLKHVSRITPRNVQMRAKRFQFLDERAHALREQRVRRSGSFEAEERCRDEADRRHRHDLRDLVHE